MEPQDIETRLKATEEKLEMIWQSVEKTRKYFLISMWTTVVLFVLPLVGLVFAIPVFINSYLKAFDGLL